MAKRTAKKTAVPDVSTEEKIKRAALKLFTRKGYAATRTRDISAEAGINIALLNYYYGSKQKLFELVMTELLAAFFQGIIEILNDTQTTIDEKIRQVVEKYTTLLREQPDVPLFILSEVRNHPERLAVRVGLKRMFGSFFFEQLKKEMKSGKVKRGNPMQYLINLISLSIFPYIAAPLIRHIADMGEGDFQAFVQARTKLIPEWMEAIMKPD